MTSCRVTLHVCVCVAAGFDQLVQESKDEAEEALKRIPLIEQQIEDAEDTTRRANQNLADALRDAELARNLGADADDIATMAAEVSDF